MINGLEGSRLLTVKYTRSSIRLITKRNVRARGRVTAIPSTPRNSNAGGNTGGEAELTSAEDSSATNRRNTVKYVTLAGGLTYRFCSGTRMVWKDSSLANVRRGTPDGMRWLTRRSCAF